MVYEGTQATDYEPYKESSITANLPEGEFIGKISDTYKDTLKVEYNEDDGQHYLKLYKNVGKVVLNGTEAWTDWILTGEHPEYITGYLLDNYVDYDNSSGADIRAICNYFKVYSNGWVYAQSFGLRQVGDTLRRFYVAIDKNITPTLDDFKTWLSNNNVELYYKLATPYVVDLGIVDMPITYNEITNLFTDSNLSLTINAKYYRNFISTVRNLQVNEKALKQELVDINTRLSALESAQTSVISESEVVE